MLALAVAVNLRAQQEPTPHPLVGTWELVFARTADGKTNQAYVDAFKGKQRLKIITPTHFLCLTVDPATRKITAAHGGRCLLGKGELTEWGQFATEPSWVSGGKALHQRARCEGDTFIQTAKDGNEEIWRRANAADVKVATSPAAAEKVITLVGEAICAKCALHQAEDCELALQVDAAGAKIAYFLQPDDVRKRFESQLQRQGINWCATPTKVVATGMARQINGRPVIVVIRLDPDRPR
jgi:hypothetical protein